VLADIKLPDLVADQEPEILNDPVETLHKSPTYPYGISDRMVEKLRDAQILTVRDLYEASESELDAIEYVGEYRVRLLKKCRCASHLAIVCSLQVIRRCTRHVAQVIGRESHPK
jgi:hypothetical protein